MTPINRLAVVDPDGVFFAQHPDRNLHVRKAHKQEFSGEFFSLGDHDMDRRMVLCWRVPAGREFHGKVIRIPFLAFADETIADTDEVLRPMLDALMKDAAKKYGMMK